MAGYSGTPLAKKLGVKQGHVVAILHEPAGFRETLDVVDVEFADILPDTADVVIAFVTEADDLRAQRNAVARAIFPNGAIWIAWPKRASKVPTDITEDVIRDVVLPHGLVDNKVCAIDDTWSGLRLVWRKERRR